MVVKKQRKKREFTSVRVQQTINGQFYITIPETIAKEWLDVKKGDKVTFKPRPIGIVIFKK